MRAALRYHGGKYRLASWIISNFPKHDIYVEPYGGGASVLLQKNPTYSEVYNDLDGEVVNLFRVIRDRGDELRAKLELTPYSRVEFVEAYEETSDELERARRTLVKSFMGFGSAAVTQETATKPGAGFKADVNKYPTGFRAQSHRSGTTPAHDWANYPYRLHEIITRLQGVTIENRDACEVMRQQDSNRTLHYVDPPYVHSTRGLKKHRTPQSYRHEMTDEQHTELSECLHALAGMIVLSGYRCELYDRLYAGWTRVEKATHADGARDRVECLWLSPNCVERTQGELFEAVS